MSGAVSGQALYQSENSPPKKGIPADTHFFIGETMEEMVKSRNSFEKLGQILPGWVNANTVMSFAHSNLSPLPKESFTYYVHKNHIFLTPLPNPVALRTFCQTPMRTYKVALPPHIKLSCLTKSRILYLNFKLTCSL